MKATPAAKAKKINSSGIAITIIATIAFAWAIYQLLALGSERSGVTGKQMRENEIAAYRNLERIAAAQEAYIQKDWDGDGQKVYAVFYVHLWRSVADNGEAIAVNLIPQKLAFAMDISSPLDGYYFVDLRRRRIDLKTAEEFDYTNEWGAAAVPGITGRTGVLTFIVDQAGEIHAASRMHSEPEFPGDPVASGWSKIASINELKKFQKTVPYPE